MSDQEHDDGEEFEEPEERLFELEEAEELLPQIEAWLTEAIDNRKRVVLIEHEFSQVQNRILLYGGILPQHSYLADKRLERDGYARVMQDALARITETGCVVKDLEKGLIDFLSLRGDEQVYLCWKLGEDHIEYWHGRHEGYAGRKRIDASQPDDLPGNKPN